ncbi:hypothetical protein MJ575_02560 [Klebsiella pneumoniae]|nr:hypothetical protein MJ575_02560 [Klebsiella pneumoniae]
MVAGLTLAGARQRRCRATCAWRWHGRRDRRQELKVSKITVLILGVVADLLGILFENQNIAFMVGGLLHRRQL